MRRWTIVAVAILGLPLAGCFFSNPDYPQSWSPLVVGGNGCEKIVGSYDEVGSGDDALTSWYKGPLLLHAALLDEEGKRALSRNRHDIEHVDLKLVDDVTLRVFVFEKGQPIAEATYSEKAGTLRCTADGAQINTYNGLTRGLGNPVAGYQHDSMTLLRAGDGDLVIEASSGTFGLVFMLFPIGEAETHWIRFQPFSSEQAARKAAQKKAEERAVSDRNKAVIAVAREYITKNLPTAVRFLSWDASVVDSGDEWAVVFLSPVSIYESNESPEIFVDKAHLDVVRVER